MSVSNQDCIDAGKDVIEHVNMYLPEGFLTKYSVNENIGNLFNVLSAAEFERQFNIFYSGFFAHIFGKGAIKSDQVNGFATPAPHYNRKLYIQDPGGANKGTIRHEFIHWLQHYNFYPKYYISDGTDSADVVEGVTEYFTRQIITGRTSYPRQYKKMKSLIDGTPQLINTIGRASFFGDTDAIEKIHRAYWN